MTNCAKYCRYRRNRAHTEILMHVYMTAHSPGLTWWGYTRVNEFVHHIYFRHYICALLCPKQARASTFYR